MSIYQILILGTNGEVVLSINLSKNVVPPQKSAEFVKDAFIFSEEVLNRQIDTIMVENRFFVINELSKDLLIAIMTDKNEYETIKLNAKRVVDFLYNEVKELDKETLEHVLENSDIQEKIIKLLKNKPKHFEH